MKTPKEEFIDNIRKISKDKQWLDDYFDFLNELLTDLKIKENSTEIITTNKLKIKVGNRTMVMPHTNNRICLIMPLEARKEIEKNYKAFINPEFFKDRFGDLEALWVEFDRDMIYLEDYYIFNNWKKAVKNEIISGGKSRIKDNHCSECFKAIMEIDYRKQIIEEL